MTWGLTAAAAGTVISGAIGASSASNSSSAAKTAAQLQTQAADKASNQQRNDMMPWTTAGGNAITELGNETQQGGKFNTAFMMADATNSSAEQTALDAGKNAIDNSAAAKGGLLSTNNVQDNTKFAESTAASFQNQAFNQWLQQNQQQLNAQQSVAQVGQSAAGNVADNVSNLTLGGANATAAGVTGAATAQNAGATSIGNTIGGLAGLFGKSLGSGTSTGTSPAVTYDPTMYTDPGYAEGSDAGNPSDERLKTNVKRVGHTDEGTPIYTYTMKGGNKTLMGVMAQDIQKDQPEAVATMGNGFKKVYYSKVK